MTTIKSSVDVQVVGGPRVNFNDALEVDTYDVFTVVVAKGGADQVVHLVPAGVTVKLLLIRSSAPDDLVTFDNGAGTVKLKNAVLLAGGAVDLLAAAPASLTFNNNTAADVTVTILVGRDSTP